MPLIDEDEEALGVLPNDSVVFESKAHLSEFIKRTLWLLYEKNKDRSFKVKKWGISFSVKAEYIYPIFVLFLGENPYATA
jgi:hypothetical protein